MRKNNIILITISFLGLFTTTWVKAQEGVIEAGIKDIMKQNTKTELENISLNGQQRKKILDLFQLAISWHYKRFNEIKSLEVLQAVLH